MLVEHLQSASQARSLEEKILCLPGRNALAIMGLIVVCRHTFAKGSARPFQKNVAAQYMGHCYFDIEYKARYRYTSTTSTKSSSQAEEQVP